MTYDPLLPPKHILQTEMVAKGGEVYTVMYSKLTLLKI